MEIEGSDGSKTRLKPDTNTVFGRANGFHLTDLSVSRRHLSLDLNPSPNTQTTPRVSFEVLGKNPVWVFSKNHENGKIKAFKRFQRGELGVDDLFCVSAKTPIWFTLKTVEEIVEERESENEEINRRVNDDLSQSLEDISGVNFNEDSGLNSVDVSDVDPVKEFGFLVIGHEFDQYPKQMIHDIKNWDWFLDDPKRDTDDEDDSQKKGTMGGRRKRKKTRRGDDDDNVDEEWAAESEGDEATTNARKVQRPKYSTRSKDQGVHDKGKTSRKSSTKATSREKEEESEDEEDETLGGFVVHDDTVEEDELGEDDEEEEFTDDEDELED